MKRQQFSSAGAADDQDEECECDCSECREGDCSECSNVVVDPDCERCPNQDTRGAKGAAATDPAGQLLTIAADFFSGDSASDDVKAAAWTKLQSIATEAGIGADDDEDDRARRNLQLELTMNE